MAEQQLAEAIRATAQASANAPSTEDAPAPQADGSTAAKSNGSSAKNGTKKSQKRSELPEFVNNTYTLHISNANDGGVGKSTLARLLVEYYRHHHSSNYVLVDADPKMDVAVAYAPDLYAKWEQKSGVSTNFFELSAAAVQVAETEDLLAEQILVSSDPTYSYLGDRLLQLACQKDVILVQPSNNLSGLMAWLDDNNINQRQDRQFQVVSWWLSHGTQRGQDAFVNFVNRYPNLNHVFVINQGITSAVPNWSRFQLQPRIGDLLGQQQVKLAQLTRFRSDPAIVARVEQGESFERVIKTLHPEIGNKVQYWLETNWSSLKATGYL
jgi:hypothetical protein